MTNILKIQKQDADSAGFTRPSENRLITKTSHPIILIKQKKIIASDEAQNPKKAYSKFIARRRLGAEPIIKDV